MINFLVHPFIGGLVMFRIKRHGWLMGNDGQTSLMVSSIPCYLCRLMISFVCFSKHASGVTFATISVTPKVA